MKKRIHLICNAHIDPVWLWQWDEGAAEAVSTFRVAADFCEEFDAFVFNHNEAILYQWVEKFEPALFARIQRLVKEGRWHIMGGWFIQPDCNMPSGESFIRHILSGRQYFKEKFGAEPTTAINFDPFGHTRGLVQILKKSGYDSYLFCRPLKKSDKVDVDVIGYDEFVWVGYDGSEVLAHRGFSNYLSRKGLAAEKIKRYLEQEMGGNEVGAVLWGVGNHGGGPSREDLIKINELIANTHDFELIHSTPEQYFSELEAHRDTLPRRESDINPWAVGCYTTQIRIKQQHRLLENELYAAEKILSHAALSCGLPYPHRELGEAAYDLMFAQFHDILPGTTVQIAENDSLRMISHGLEIVSRLKTHAFFQLTQGQRKAVDGQLPIMVYNPHPYPVDSIFHCEFSVLDANPALKVCTPILYQDNVRVPSQFVKTYANIGTGKRKHIIARAVLAPMQITRFDCSFAPCEEMPLPKLREEGGYITFTNEALAVRINCSTGYIDSYRVNGKEYLQKQAFRPLVIDDDDHSIGTYSRHYRNVMGAFELMSANAGTQFSSVTGKVLDSVRVIEDGEVVSIVEAVLCYNQSNICIRYILPKQGTEMEIELIAHWNEKGKMLKLSIPTVFRSGEYLGQVAYGSGPLPMDGKEAVSQKWCAVVAGEDAAAVSVMNDGIYGSDYKDGEIRLSLLRSPRFGCLTPREQRISMYNDGYVPRVDQGERVYKFWFNAGDRDRRMSKLDSEAAVRNEKPYALSFFPSGQGIAPAPLLEIDDSEVVLSAFKRSEKNNGFIMRLFNPLNLAKTVTGVMRDLKQIFELAPYEVKTFYIADGGTQFTECDMVENLK